MLCQPWQLPSSHSCHGAPLPAPPHKTISKHAGWPLCAAALGVGHHGGHLWPFRSWSVDRRCRVVVSCVPCRNMQGNVSDNRQCRPNKVIMSTLVGIGDVGAAASTPNWSLCHSFLKGRSWRNDAWWWWWWNRRRGAGGDNSYNRQICTSINHGGHRHPMATTGPHSQLLSIQ